MSAWHVRKSGRPKAQRVYQACSLKHSRTAPKTSQPHLARLTSTTATTPPLRQTAAKQFRTIKSRLHRGKRACAKRPATVHRGALRGRLRKAAMTC